MEGSCLGVLVQLWLCSLSRYLLGHAALLTSAPVLPTQFSVYICFHYSCTLLLFYFLTSSGSESCFPRPLSNNPSSAVLCTEGCSLNLFPQKAHYKTCLISAYLSLLMPDRVNLQTLPAVDPAVCSGLFWPASTF